MPASRTTTAKVSRVGARRSTRPTKPSQRASSTTSAGSYTNPITPPASVTPAAHSAPSRRKLLPHNYVPLRPRTAFLIFRGQVAKNSGGARKGKRAQDALLREAGERWYTLSDAEQLYYQRLADEERALHTKRFPDYVYLAKRRRRYNPDWSAARDDVFVINEEGVIQYAPPSDEEPRRRTHAGTKVDNDTSDVDEDALLYFPSEIEGYQSMDMDDGIMPFDPEATLVPAAPMDTGCSPESSNYVDDLLPQQILVGGTSQFGQTFFDSHPVPMMHGNTLWN